MAMFNSPKPDTIEGWTCIYETSTEYESQLIKSYLNSRDIDCRILSKHDSAFDLNVGDMSVIFLYVPEEMKKQAEEAIEEWQNGSSNLPDEDG